MLYRRRALYRSFAALFFVSCTALLLPGCSVSRLGIGSVCRINEDGQFARASDVTGRETQDLGKLGGAFSGPSGINTGDPIIGWSTSEKDEEHGFRGHAALLS